MDFKKWFVDVEVSWPGSVGDSCVFKTSCLNMMYVDWLAQFPMAKLITGDYDNGEVIYEDIPAFILADSAYPNSKHLVTTFKVTETSDPVINALNKKLGGARYHVENAFGILKGRFHIFQRPLECAVEDIRFVIILISAVFVLHNFLIDIQDTSSEWQDEITEEPRMNDDVDVDEVVEDLDSTTQKVLIKHMRWKLEN